MIIYSISVLSRSSFVVFIIEVFGPESLFVTTLIQREAIDLTPGLPQSGPVYSLEVNLQLVSSDLDRAGQ